MQAHNGLVSNFKKGRAKLAEQEAQYLVNK